MRLVETRLVVLLGFVAVVACTSEGEFTEPDDPNSDTDALQQDLTGQGLTGEYFDNADLTASKLTRLDPRVAFDWRYGSPDPQIGNDTFSVRWTGQVVPRYSENYKFYVRADDGIRLWVNDQLLIDGWKNQAATEYSGSIALVAGQAYSIKLEYYEAGLLANVRLAWSSPTQKRQTIPQARLLPSTSGPTADTEAPTAPTRLTASNVTDTAATLSWQAATDNVGVTGYEVSRNGVAVVTVGGLSLADSGLQPSTVYTYVVRAKDAAGNIGPASSSLSVTTSAGTGTGMDAGTGTDAGTGADAGGGGGALPGGVTLQAIDGERMLTPTVMSHDFFQRRGLTHCSNNPSFPNDFDSTNYFPNGAFYGLYGLSQTDFNRYADLKLSGTVGVTGNTNFGLMGPNSAWGMITHADYNQEAPAAGDWTFGLHVDERDPAPFISSWANSVQDTRAMSLAGTWNLFWSGGLVKNGDAPATLSDPVRYPTPNGSRRGIDIFSADFYWFAVSVTSFGRGQASVILSNPMDYNSPSHTATADDVARGSNYGNMIDCYRSWSNGTNLGRGDGAAGKSGAPATIPMWALPETATGKWTGGRLVTSDEMSWAAWSSIIHGARGIDWFTDFGISGDFSGPSDSRYIALKGVGTTVASLATVLNSPFATGYLSDVSPHGYVFPVYEPNWLNGGIEASVKWDGSNFYIIATTRYGESGYTGKTATFTLNASVNATTATRISDGVSAASVPITITNHQFTDTFPNPWSVRIYKIGP